MGFVVPMTVITHVTYFLNERLCSLKDIDCFLQKPAAYLPKQNASRPTKTFFFP